LLFLLLLRQTELLRRAPDAPPRAPTAGCAAAHGLLLPFFSMCGCGGGACARSSRRRRHPRTELAAARGSHGSLGAEQQEMARGSGQAVTTTRRHSWRATGFVHVASVCSTCFRCFIRMLQVFRADVVKINRGVSALRHEGGMEDVAEP
jgi:hypothetical protein